MATVAELTAAYTHLLLRPEPRPGVCEVCWNLTDGYHRCYACTHTEQWLAHIAPISYSVAHEQLHHVLAGYKRWPVDIAARPQRELAAIIWRHLRDHEACLAAAAGIDRFDVITTVPAGTPTSDERQPLRHIVGRLVEPARDRYARLLIRSTHPAEPRRFEPAQFASTRALSGEAILLIDDTWTTGASAQSAAAALVGAGAGTIVALVVGRHVNRAWGHNDDHLRRLERPFDWGWCVSCRNRRGARIPAPRRAAAG